MSTSKLSAALDAAARGFRVFPVLANSRIPAINAWPDEATSDPAAVAAWWATNPDFNIGIATGHGVFVIDADCKKGKPGLASLDMLDMLGLPASLRVTTPSGGAHVYLRSKREFGNRADTIADYPGIDIRGERGYVLAPGSTIDGIPYTHVDSDTIADAPEWLEDIIGRHTTKAVPSMDAALVDLDLPDNIANAIDWLAHHAPEAVEGQGGDTTTYSVAAELRARGVSKETALELLAEHWNEQKASPPWQIDELEIKVENAFAHGQGAPGYKTAAGEFGVVDIEIGEPPARGGADVGIPVSGQSFRKMKRSDQFISALISIDTAGARLATAAQDPLIEGVFNKGILATMIGPQKSGKTFNLLDIGVHIAAGRDWCGRTVAQGVVLHILGEGEGGVPARVEALRQAKGIPFGTPHYVLPLKINLFSSNKDAAEIVNLARHLAKQHDLPVQLVIIDTLARAMPGGDENVVKDVNKVIDNADFIRESTGATVIVAHHTGWGDKSRSRGSTALPGAIDGEMLLDGGKIVFQNMRDFEEPEPIPYRLENTYAGVDANGNDRFAAVVRYLSDGEFGILSDAEEAYLAALGDALREAKAEAVSSAAWDEQYRRAIDPTWEKGNVAPKGCSEQQLRRMRKSLVEGKNVVRIRQKFGLQEAK